MFDMY